MVGILVFAALLATATFVWLRDAWQYFAIAAEQRRVGKSAMVLFFGLILAAVWLQFVSVLSAPA